MKNLVIFLSIALVVGCGGSGGDSSESTTADTNQTLTAVDSDNTDEQQTEESTQTEVEPEEQEAIPVTQMADLYVGPELLLRETYTIVLAVNLGELASSNAVINVCRMTADGELDSTNCILQAPLTNGQLETEIALSDQHDLIAQIWRHDVSSEPLAYQWQFFEDSTLQEWTIN